MADSEWYSHSDDLALVKQELRIGTADDSDDSILKEYGTRANRHIDNMIFSHKDKVPDTDITKDLKEAAIIYILRRYKVYQDNVEQSNEYKKQFDEIMEAVICRLKAIPEGRGDTHVYANNYRSEPLRSRQRYFGD